jgi:hypothetical protein
MSFDCKYKGKNYKCLRLKVECSPGIKGCVLHGKYIFAFQEDEGKEDKKNTKKDKV